MPPSPTTQTNIQTIPVMGPHGEELPGMVGAPGAAGGPFRIHNVPKESGGEALNKIVEDRKARLAQTNTTSTATSSSKEGQHKLPRGTEQSKSIEEQKVDRAHELAKEHPDWTREDIIAEVKDEFSKR